ncbi:hypothetical protein BGW39_011817 [Mortierella sp. 14UC]|nr:hypothetical protein BGW39_011817 [Mortierella sp. 14UC]
MSESHTIQRKVYAQLGALVSLERLTLRTKTDTRDYIIGYGEDKDVYFNPLFQTNYLELSLESGLDLLDGLTNLKMLNVSHTAHRIGETSCGGWIGDGIVLWN